MVVSVSITDFCDVTPCYLVDLLDFPDCMA